jgi:hypothetical protein
MRGRRYGRPPRGQDTGRTKAASEESRIAPGSPAANAAAWAQALVFFLAPLAFASPGWSEDGNFKRQCASADGFLHIDADHPVAPARCAAIAARALKAFDFAAEAAGWTGREALRARPLQFRLLGGSMKGLGYAEGRNLMVVRDEYLDDPLSEGTLAHELTHIQDARQLLGRTRLPSFLAEGRALVIGHAYRMALGQRENSYDARMAASAATFSAEDAGRLLRDYRGAGWDNQAVGTFLVEYMRVGWNGGTPDVLARLSRMVEAMGGGEDFDAAFRKEFGRRFGDLRRDFARFLDATKGEPEARLEGTMWRNAGRRP